MGDIKKGGGFNHDKTKNYYPKKDSERLEKYILKNGDLLMSMTDMKDAISLLGHTALMIYDNEYIVNQRVGLMSFRHSVDISTRRYVDESMRRRVGASTRPTPFKHR